MFSFIRGTSAASRILRPCFVSLSGADSRCRPVISCNGAGTKKFISTSDGAQKSAEHMMKLNKIGGLPSDLVNKRKMKKTSRTLSTLQNHSVPLAARATVSIDECREFMAVFPDVVRDLTEIANKHNIYDAGKWFSKALQYNVPRGKKNRGILTVLAYKNLVNPDELTSENIKLAQYLGWCVEMLQSFFIMIDDVMDNSTTRRGQLCWHRVDGVDLISINDASMIQNSIFSLLKKRFKHLDCYVDLLELINEITFITNCGQSLDMQMAAKNATFFTMDKYKSIVENKTSYYSFYLPVALAMHMAGFKDQEAFRQSKMILLEMGNFYQIQDDFLDCFGNPEITGKQGTDIQDNKCSWLAVVCMQRADEKQKQIMAECYGHDAPEKISRVKQLYKELGIPNTYATYEEESYNMIKTHIQQTSRGVPHKVFLQILNKIYQRDS